MNEQDQREAELLEKLVIVGRIFAPAFDRNGHPYPDSTILDNLCKQLTFVVKPEVRDAVVKGLIR